MFDAGLTVKEKLDASHSWGHKVKLYHDCVHMHKPYKKPLGKWAFSVDIITLSKYPFTLKILTSECMISLLFFIEYLTC